MANLRFLEVKYSKNYRTAFEDMSTLIFCSFLGLLRGVNRPRNLNGIESEPVKIGDKVYAYQAKYYDSQIRLRDKKQDFIKSIHVARKKGVTNLLFFVNKDEDWNNRDDKVPSYLEEIESIANGQGSEQRIELDWWFKSIIEETLEFEKYKYIRNIFLDDFDQRKMAISNFYEYANKTFICGLDEIYFGEVSLCDCYIETAIKVKDTNNKEKNVSIYNYLESFVDSNSFISVISGEPGQGKTTLCIKAMNDFYKNGWLSGKVSNVFRFSLNPAGTDALSNNFFNLYPLLSWGDDRKNQVIHKDDCNTALVFFDGFDELLEWHPGFNLKRFIECYIVPFQKDTKAHIIITTRKIAVDSEQDEYLCSNGIYIPVNQMQPISKKQQMEWIELYINELLKRSTNEVNRIGTPEKEFIELTDYLEKYRRLAPEDGLQQILGIPVILRMVVGTRYLPKKEQSITQIYDSLFHLTWNRHWHKLPNDNESYNDQEREVRKKLSNHALNIYSDDNNTALVDRLIDASWVFSFYMTHDTTSVERYWRVGFFHRSFYQYFLAQEITSWFRDYNYYDDEITFINKLFNLERRKIDGTTLSYIGEIYETSMKREDYCKVFEKVYDILKRTDGIREIISAKDEIGKEKEGKRDLNQQKPSVSKTINAVNPIERANNVFWNIVSICTVCGNPVSRNSINENTLSIYNMCGCCLKGAKLGKTGSGGLNLERSQFKGANLSGADLSGVFFMTANLNEANLSGANLDGANLSGVCLNRANLRSANLSSVKLESANCSWANFRNANLSRANLRRANLQGVNFEGANLSQTNLSGADLSDANLRKANLNGADLSGANLSRANLFNTSLFDASISGANFCGVYYC